MWSRRVRTMRAKRGLCVFQPNVLPTHAAPRTWRTCGGLLAARLRPLQEDDRFLDKFYMKAMQQKAECGSGHLHAHIFRQLSASHLPPAGICLGRISLKSCHQWIVPAGQKGIPPIPPPLRQAHGRRPGRCVLDAHAAEGLGARKPPVPSGHDGAYSLWGHVCEMSDTSNQLTVVLAHMPCERLARQPALLEQALQFGPRAFGNCSSASLAVGHKHGPAQEHLHARACRLDQESHAARTGWQKRFKGSRAAAASGGCGAS